MSRVEGGVCATRRALAADHGPTFPSYTIARDWARQQYLPWAVAAAYAEWYATVGRNLFDDQEEAFEWWAATPEYIRHWDE